MSYNYRLNRTGDLEFDRVRPDLGDDPITKRPEDNSDSVSESGRKDQKKIIHLLAIVLLIAHMALLVIGSMHFNHCPIDVKIPGFMIGLGLVGFIGGIADIFVFWSIHADKEYNGCGLWIPTLIFVFVLAVCEGVYTFKAYKHHQTEDPSSKDYCEGTVYSAAFVYSIVWSIIIGIPLVIIILWGIYLHNEKDINEVAEQMQRENN